MEVTEGYWVFHWRSIGADGRETTDLASDIKRNNVGKWMLFYPNRMMNSKWSNMCKAFDSGKLTGVIGMKCSTALLNPRSSNPDEGVIILYCNNSADRDSIMEIGHRIALHLYDYPRPVIYYKTDAQTHVGTIATGATNNSTYCLEIERPIVPLFRKKLSTF